MSKPIHKFAMHTIVKMPGFNAAHLARSDRVLSTTIVRLSISSRACPDRAERRQIISPKVR
jgi:hypothetical protein